MLSKAVPDSDHESNGLPPPTIALVVATRNRLDHLLPRVPIWAGAGFDEVIVVNTPTERGAAERIRRLCEQYGVIYIETPVSIRDLRSRARNLGAMTATTDWILFNDDDHDTIVAEIDKEELTQCTRGVDWIAGPTGDIVVLHRRASFVRMGGYPEDMVASEDNIMSNRARRSGKGGLEGHLWKQITRAPPPPPEDPLNRARNAFW